MHTDFYEIISFYTEILTHYSHEEFPSNCTSVGDKKAATKWLCDEMACDEITCDEVTCDEMPCDEVTCDEMVRDKMACDEMPATKWLRQTVVLPTDTLG